MRGLGHKPSYAIGNSLADPRIPLDAPYTNLSENIWTATESRLDAGYHYDHSYLLNEALWDSYFLSTVPRSVTSRQMEEVDFALANNRLKLRRNPRLLWRQARELVEAGLPAPQAYMAIRDRSDDDLKSYDMAASMLLLDGAFNVNSTSVHAWSALLGSFFGAKVKGKDGVQPGDEYESPFLRINEPLGSAIKDGDNVNSASEEAYLGYRSLSQSEIRALATEIVVQVKRRGPFRSLAEFINRTLPEDASSASSDWESNALQGALAAAIENAGINKRFQDEMIMAVPIETSTRNSRRQPKKPAARLPPQVLPHRMHPDFSLKPTCCLGSAHAFRPVLTLSAYAFTVTPKTPRQQMKGRTRVTSVARLFFNDCPTSRNKTKLPPALPTLPPTMIGTACTGRLHSSAFDGCETTRFDKSR